jgi:hypothetical protein
MNVTLPDCLSMIPSDADHLHHDDALAVWGLGGWSRQVTPRPMRWQPLIIDACRACDRFTAGRTKMATELFEAAMAACAAAQHGMEASGQRSSTVIAVDWLRPLPPAKL